MKPRWNQQDNNSLWLGSDQRTVEMGPKKGGKGKAKNAADEDDDWEKVLQEQIEANKALQAEEVSPCDVPSLVPQ